VTNDGRTRGPDVRALLRTAQPLVRDTAAPRVAVITAFPEPSLLADVQRTFPHAAAHPYDVGAGLADLHLGLAAHGRFDLILDLGGTPEAEARFRRVIFHLAPNGGLVMWIGLPDDEPRSSLRNLVGRLDAARSGGRVREPRSSFAKSDLRGPRRREFNAMAFSLERLDVEGPFVVAVGKGRALAKVREEDMDRLLAERAGEDRVVQTIPAQPFRSRCDVRSSDSDSLARLPTSFDAPQLSLREYHDVLCRRHQIVTKGNLVLPESFRHTRAPRLRNQALADWAPDFVREPVRASRLAEPLPGAYLYFDNEHKNHFGHFVSELLSHVWGWDRVKRFDPTARVLAPMSSTDHELSAWQYDFLEAAGIRREDLVLTKGPVRVETLFTASPMFSMPSYAHPLIEEIWTGIGDRLDARAPDRPYPNRLFCSRRVGKRRCRNGDEVEELFVLHGFDVVFPEDYPVAEQVRMFRRADVVAGYAGSGMFSAAFTGAPRHLITIRPESYTAINEYLMCAVLGHRLDEVVCRSELPQPEKGWDWNAFNSDFTLDARREGVFLGGVLQDL
jgi:capsular polysaccharide biosynthesis protein